MQLGESMRRAGRILLHEATFDDTPGMRREAEARRHSTVAEALEVAARMGAWRVLLTHFSNRYPRLADLRQPGIERAVPAFDLMDVPFSLLPSLPSLTPALACLFAHDLKSNPAEEDAAEPVTLVASFGGGKGGKGGGGKGGVGRGKGGGKGGDGRGRGRGKGVGGQGKGGPPGHYVCHICGGFGHWIQQCPQGGSGGKGNGKGGGKGGGGKGSSMGD